MVIYRYKEVVKIKIAYIRVSTVEQNEERQIKAMQNLNIEKMFVDKCSGKTTNRPQLNKLKEFIDMFYRINDELEVKQQLELYIESFSRLARSTKDLLELVDYFNKRNVKIVSLKENLDTSTPTGQLMLTMIAAIAQFERDCILERQKEGIAIAKEKGKYKGRKKINYPDNWKEVYEKWKMRGITGTKAIELLGLKRNTFYNLVKEYEKENKLEG